MRIRPINRFIKFFTGSSVVGIALCPFGIYVKRPNDVYLVNHESIHWKQQIEMLILPFYIWYVLEYFIRLFSNSGNAYMSLAFEREAYANANNLDYLKNRKPYSWLKYIKKNK